MGYYAGGYYAGGYYAGGLFGNLFRGVTGTIGGAVKGFLKGGPVGALGGAAGGAIGAIGQNIQMSTLEAGGSGSALTPAMIAAHKAAVARGGAGGGAPKVGTSMIPTPGSLGPAMAGFAGMHTPGVGIPRGYHPNRSTYAVRGGGTSHYPPGLQLVVKGTSLVRNRRMNWGNGRALGRAERRIGAFLRHARKYIRWVNPGKKGRAVPKIRRKK